MKQNIVILLIVLIGQAAYSAPSPSSLEKDLQTLKLEDRAVPAGINNEKYYAVQSRSIPLKYRLELATGVGNNFSPGGFLTSQNIDGKLLFYFSDRVFVAASGSHVSNGLNDSANRLWQNEKIYPDIAPVKLRTDMTVGYHLFYGKFRLSMDTVFYFDQYWALGGGAVKTDNGLAENWSPALVGDVGFAFWFGRHWSLRLGLKDYYFKEVRRLGTESTQHFVGHVGLGYVFGGSGV